MAVMPIVQTKSKGYGTNKGRTEIYVRVLARLDEPTKNDTIDKSLTVEIICKKLCKRYSRMSENDSEERSENQSPYH